MILDTNLVIYHLRKQRPLPVQTIFPVVVVGELYSFAIRQGWGAPRKLFLDTIIKTYTVVPITDGLISIYAEIDAFSQGQLPGKPLLKPGTSQPDTAKNMGKNDLWIASIAIALDEELHTADNDFDHLVLYGLKLVKYNANDPFGEKLIRYSKPRADM